MNPIEELHTAAKIGDIANMYACLDKGINVDATLDDSLKTALHHAAAKAQFAAVSLLLDRGANPNARDSEGATPLLHAVFEALLEDSDNQSPYEMINVARFGNDDKSLNFIKIINKLLRAGADVSLGTNGLVGTPLDATSRFDETLMSLHLKAILRIAFVPRPILDYVIKRGDEQDAHHTRKVFGGVIGKIFGVSRNTKLIAAMFYGCFVEKDSSNNKEKINNLVVGIDDIKSYLTLEKFNVFKSVFPKEINFGYGELDKLTIKDIQGALGHGELAEAVRESEIKRNTSDLQNSHRPK